MGEAVAKTNGRIPYENIVRDVCKNIGYDCESKGLDSDTMAVTVNIVPQSQEIYNAVHKLKRDNIDQFGAGDQGLMFGYATDEWDQETLHPLTHQLANLICEELSIARKSGEIKWLRPDCKA